MDRRHVRAELAAHRAPGRRARLRTTDEPREDLGGASFPSSYNVFQMWFLTQPECEAWTHGRGFPAPIADLPFAANAASQVSLPLHDLPFTRLTWLSQFIANTLAGSDETLLWVTQWGVWPSSENLHLFYRLRESYGERRTLADAPGHRFAKHETPDLATYVQLALISGWDFHVLPTPTYLTGFGSHDEFFDFRSDRPDACHEIRAALANAGVKFT